MPIMKQRSALADYQTAFDVNRSEIRNEVSFYLTIPPEIQRFA